MEGIELIVVDAASAYDVDLFIDLSSSSTFRAGWPLNFV